MGDLPLSLSGDPQMYQMSFLIVEVPRNFPVEGYRGGGNFHLQVPNRQSDLPPGALMSVLEAMIACAAYLIRSFKAHFCLDGYAKGLRRYCY